ncbi:MULTISPECIES: amidohydrolase family protein [unclassified Kribbella]|uniref:amidohydrolase family protein n=1 Tax=unclassified Kribbella TaxID=2644121 RepID=UPI00301A83B3
MNRIDVHHHLIPSFYREALRDTGVAEAGGRAWPDWSSEAAVELMDLLGITTAIVSISMPGTSFLKDADDAVALAQKLNDFSAGLPDRFGYFATLPVPDLAGSAREAARVLDNGTADGVVLLANTHGEYLGAEGRDELWRALDERGAVVFIHPAELPGPEVVGVPAFAADFLLDTTRAAYLLVRNGIVRKYPNIRFILGHAGGMVPYASHRMAFAISADTGASVLDVLDDFRGFYFDTALSSSPAALPSLLAFAQPERVLFGSDWPFAPDVAGQYFAAGLDEGVDGSQLAGINHANAQALFPRLATTRAIKPTASPVARIRHTAHRVAVRGLFKLVQPQKK